MANIDQIKRGLAAYADEEILNKLPVGGVKKFGIGTVLTLFIDNLDRTMAAGLQHPLAGMLGIKNADDTINVNALSEALKKNMGDEGVKVNLALIGFSFGDMTFHRSDVDALRNYIMNA